MVGANGVTASGESVGLLRDRAQLLGRSAPTPIDVDSLDEVLFITSGRRSNGTRCARETLAWHAYAVEYGMRMRTSEGVWAPMDSAISHSSLTMILPGSMWPTRQSATATRNDRPIETTCGTIVAHEPRWRQSAIVKQYGWRWRWLRLSLVGRRVRTMAPSAAVVLADIRRDIDLIPFSDADPLYLFDLDRSGNFVGLAPDALRLSRFGKPVVARSLIDVAQVEAELVRLPRGSRFLVVGLQLAELARLTRSETVAEANCVVGIQEGLLWLLGGVPVRELPTEWSAPRATPFGAPGRGRSVADNAGTGVGESR